MRRPAATVMISAALGFLALATAQEKPASATILVDTDDTCQLTVDGADYGTVTPTHARKISTGLGEHIVKCTVPGAPDLMWRKVVELKTPTQAAALVTLKALHLQWDQATERPDNRKPTAPTRAQSGDSDNAPGISRIALGLWLGVQEINPFLFRSTVVIGHQNGALAVSFGVAWKDEHSSGARIYTGKLKAVSDTSLVNDGPLICQKARGLDAADYNGINNWEDCKSTVPKVDDGEMQLSLVNPNGGNDKLVLALKGDRPVILVKQQGK